MDVEDRMSFRKWRLGGRGSPEINIISLILTAFLIVRYYSPCFTEDIYKFWY